MNKPINQLINQLINLSQNKSINQLFKDQLNSQILILSEIKIYVIQIFTTFFYECLAFLFI